MPQAAKADSISAPEIQPSLTTDLTVFHDTLSELEALIFMLEASLSIPGSIHPDIRSGIFSLLRGLTEDFRDIYGGVEVSFQRLEQLSAYERAVSRLRGDTFDFSDAHKAINRFCAKQKTRYVGAPLRLPPLAILELERAAGKHGRSISNLICVIVTQWLVREGWLTIPEAAEEEAAQ